MAPHAQNDPDGLLGLDEAYAVKTPEDNRRLYKAWATTYDDGFASARGYSYPARVAAVFDEKFDLASSARVLDVGCGTGLVAATLREAGFDNLHGIDISPEMLAVAHGKDLYASLTEVDVTERLPWQDNQWQAVISAGTFTHGHLGPEPILELVRVASSGAPFALGVNAEHFESNGFEATLASLVNGGVVDQLSLTDIPMYDIADDEHGTDRALVVTFEVR